MNIDTDKIKKCGNDIINLSNDLSDIIETLYSRISNMPVTTGEWVGESAKNFAVKSNKEKVDAVELKNKIFSFGNTLIECAEKYEIEANKANI